MGRGQRVAERARSSRRGLALAAAAACVITGCSRGPSPFEIADVGTERRLDLAASLDLTDSGVGPDRTPLQGSVAWVDGHIGLAPGSGTTVVVDVDPREPAGALDHSVRRGALGTVVLDNADGDGSLVLREPECEPGGGCAGNEVHLETGDLQPGTYVHTFELTWTAGAAEDPVAPSGTVQARLVITVT